MIDGAGDAALSVLKEGNNTGEETSLMDVIGSLKKEKRKKNTEKDRTEIKSALTSQEQTLLDSP